MKKEMDLCVIMQKSAKGNDDDDDNYNDATAAADVGCNDN